MAGEPTVTVIGNLVADPELNYTSTGRAVANFTVVSTPRTLNRQTNEWEDGESMFVRGSVWGNYAENIAESLTKGTRVIVHGRLKVRSYQRNDGSQGTSIEMEVEEVGPALRFAKASVTRATGGSGNGFNQGQASRGQASYDAPSGGAMHDPWAVNAPASAFDDPPQF
ncbi:MAG: single-stranded DNA-binding protein [Arcanobacterium sp.]|nr:single-stranded DNA-binding protein [Arcanobacterium sp.]